MEEMGKLLLDTMPYFKKMKEIAVDREMQRMQWSLSAIRPLVNQLQKAWQGE